MPSVIEDFAFIAKRAQEIRIARYHELGVSDPTPANPPQTVPEQAVTGAGFRYAPGFDIWQCLNRTTLHVDPAGDQAE